MRIEVCLSPQNNGTYTSFMTLFSAEYFSGNQELRSMSGKPRLTYLNGRGRMEPVRWLLAAAGVEVSWHSVHCSGLLFSTGLRKEQFNMHMEDKRLQEGSKFIWPVALHVCNYIVLWLVFGMQTQWRLAFIRDSISPLKLIIHHGSKWGFT